MNTPELLVPAGNLSKLRTAVAFGADAIYVGAEGFSMRPDQAAFSVEDLAEGLEYTHAKGRKLYVAVNTLLFEDDLGPLRDWIEATRSLAFDAVIVSDAGGFSLIRELRSDLPIHISTQMSTANSGSASFWKEAGASRIVLARECTLEQASAMTNVADIETEIFIHGAMCVAVSGRCLLSAHLCGHSGSLGECKHSCRWEWQLVEEKRPGETITLFETGRETIFLGSKDLCLIEHMPELFKSGVSSLKIEGRMKSEFYVGGITRIYRAAIDACAMNPDGYSVADEWMEELDAISHRPYSTGFAFGYPENEPAELQTHNSPVSTHEMVAILEGESDALYEVTVKNPFKTGQTLEWIGPGMTQGVATVASIAEIEGKPREAAHPGTRVMLDFGPDVSIPEFAIFRRLRS